MTIRILYFELLPEILISKIGDQLELCDRISFMKSSNYAHSILLLGLRKFSHVQISDDDKDNFIKTSNDSKKLRFKPIILWDVLDLCHGITSAVIAIKSLPNRELSVCELFSSSMYHPGGYVKTFLSFAPSRLLETLQSLCISIDLMVDSFSKLQVPCPIEDLRYAVENLTERKFNTFIQIGFCATEYSEDDARVNNILLTTMNFIVYEMQIRGCRASIDFGANEGYVDMTVEKGNIEYSFAFFYYNPSICDPDKPEEQVHRLEFHKGDSIQDENHPVDLSQP